MSHGSHKSAPIFSFSGAKTAPGSPHFWHPVQKVVVDVGAAVVEEEVGFFGREAVGVLVADFERHKPPLLHNPYLETPHNFVNALEVEGEVAVLFQKQRQLVHVGYLRFGGAEREVLGVAASAVLGF